MKKILRPAAAFFKSCLEAVLQFEAAVAASWVAAAHRRLLWVQWRLAPQPEHFDHRIDLYYQWPANRSSFWLERGIFGGLALKNEGTLLELACGDGFNARHFYSLRCRDVLACDFDPRAIATARRKNPAPNIKYVLADIRTAMPPGEFDNIVWDAAIEHFTLVETANVLGAIRDRLKPGGILTGYTLVEARDGRKSLSHHEYEFKSKQDLMRFLAPHFTNVTVFETIHPERHNLYFWASDSTLPFAPDWPNAIVQRGDHSAR